MYQEKSGLVRAGLWDGLGGLKADVFKETMEWWQPPAEATTWKTSQGIIYFPFSPGIPPYSFQNVEGLRQQVESPFALFGCIHHTQQLILPWAMRYGELICASEHAKDASLPS